VLLHFYFAGEPKGSVVAAAKLSLSIAHFNDHKNQELKQVYYQGCDSAGQQGPDDISHVTTVERGNGVTPRQPRFVTSADHLQLAHLIPR
jgi:hypothetical protein